MTLLDRLRGHGDTAELERQIRSHARPLHRPSDLTPLMERIGEARYVLMGEASHGTREYYTWRAEISKRLIQEKGFSFIGVEGDWPDCYQVNRFIKGDPELGTDARAVLQCFNRWPTWMWANEEIAELITWLREWNAGQPEERKVGFYGIDVYSLWDSLYAVLGYLSRADGKAVETALRAFRCFEPYREDPQEYAWSTMMVPTGCEQEVARLLGEVRQQVSKAAAVPGLDGREAQFNAEQNALVARNAEQYYRTMIRGGAESWNLRDRHMMDTLDRLMAHHGPQARSIVWAHNTHIGDARATDMADAGMWNIGQLAREERGGEGVVLIGFGSYRGSVIAGRSWGAPMERMPVPPAHEGSMESAMHRAGHEDKLLLLTQSGAPPALGEERTHRAIGVVYNPENERWSNYVPTLLTERYDAFLYLDRTHAVKPLHVTLHETDEPAETFPSGM